jgi:hypothetical protein
MRFANAYLQAWSRRRFGKSLLVYQREGDMRKTSRHVPTAALNSPAASASKGAFSLDAI